MGGRGENISGEGGDNGGVSGAVSSKVEFIGSFIRGITKGMRSDKLAAVVVCRAASDTISGCMGSIVMRGGAFKPAPQRVE